MELPMSNDLATTKVMNFDIGHIIFDAEKCINDFDLRRAKKMADELSNKLLDTSLEFKGRIQGIIARLRLVALPILYSEQDVINIFRSPGFVEILKNKVPDPKERLKTKLLEYWYDQRDQLRQDIVVALHENQDLLTNIQVKTDVGPKKGTIANWLADYDLKLGFDLIDQVRVVDYLFHSESVKNLNEQERRLLGKLFDFYEFIKLSSQTASGIEEEIEIIDNGMIIDFNKGRLVKLFGNKKKDSLETTAKSIRFTEDNLSEDLVNKNQALDLIKSTPTVLKQPTPAFLFDEADEKEADRFRTLERWNTGTLEHNLREMAAVVIKENNLSFKDEVNKRRFVNLFVSFLKDVRDVVEVREAALKSVENGGLGLDGDKANRVIEILEQAKKEFESRVKNQELGIESKKEESKPKTELDKMIEGESYKIESQIKTGQIKTLEQKEPAPSVPPSPPSPVSPPVKEIKVAPMPAPVDAAQAEARRRQILEQIVSKIEADKAVAPPPVQPPVKPRLVDVKAPPRVLGPLEELRTLSVVDFRRLGREPVEALAKINKKIDIIGEASVGKRVEAVRAWQTSPVYRLYLQIGRASIEQRKTIVDIIAEREKNGETVLRLDEFNAVADFNEKIRF